MTTYIVTFEINENARKVKVKEFLKTFGPYCPIHYNAWAISTEKKSAEIRDSLNHLLIASDRIFVIRTGTEAAWRNTYGSDNSDWLKKNL